MIENIKLINTDTKEVIELDTIKTSNLVLESADLGYVQGVNNSYKYINQIGEVITNTTVGMREIEIVGWAVGSSIGEMNQTKNFLNRFVNPFQRLDLIYKTYKLNFVPYSSIQYSNTYEENNDVICKFKITGICPYPLFVDNTLSKSTGATITPKFHFPLIISTVPNPPGGVVFGEKESSLLINIANVGSVPTGMKIIFKARTGTVINPKLININTQEFFKISKTLSAGEEITVNTNIGEKSVIGLANGLESNYFKYKTFDSTWLQLAVGDNFFRYDADSGLEDLEVSIYYGNKYFEVQEWD